jgi:hypothetical protein
MRVTPKASRSRPRSRGQPCHRSNSSAGLCRRVDASLLHYILAAVVVPEDDCPGARAELSQLLLGKQCALHWRTERPSRREWIVTTIRSLPVRSLVVVGTMTNPRRQERARRLVLGRLLHCLDERQVSLAVLESRHAERDRNDLKALGAFRNQRVVSRRLLVTQGHPIQEPMLWAADAVAGAAGDRACGQPACWDVLSGLTELIDVGEV